MKLVLDLEEESIEDLSKCITILEKVIENKRNNRPITHGIEEINTQKEKPAETQTNNVPAQKMQQQEKLMDKIDLGILSKD